MTDYCGESSLVSLELSVTHSQLYMEASPHALYRLFRGHQGPARRRQQFVSQIYACRMRNLGFTACGYKAVQVTIEAVLIVTVL